MALTSDTGTTQERESILVFEALQVSTVQHGGTSQKLISVR